MHEMIKIWKFPIVITDRQFIQMPSEATILSVGTQRGVPCVWALVNTESPMGFHEIAVVGTGNPCWCADWRFVGTFQTHDGDGIWHLFDSRI